MVIRAAINGYGRIGRNILRALYESNYRHKIQIVAINDVGDQAIHAHLTRFDSTHGSFPFPVNEQEQGLQVQEDVIATFSEHNPSELPWAELNVDVVYECSGLFTRREQAVQHLTAGAKKVIISAPGTDVDATIVYGVNHHQLTSKARIISNASCTTNCLAPMAKALHQAIGIEQGTMTTIHAYTNDQHLTDAYHADPYRARSATHSIIPTKTGAAVAINWVIPELAGRLDGMALRVPTANVSVVDLHFLATRATSTEEVNDIMYKAANSDAYCGVLAYNMAPLVSVDFNHHPASSIFDATQTQVSGHWVKVMAWYDNEWGFANRMLDSSIALIAAR